MATDGEPDPSMHAPAGSVWLRNSEAVRVPAAFGVVVVVPDAVVVVSPTVVVVVLVAPVAAVVVVVVVVAGLALGFELDEQPAINTSVAKVTDNHPRARDDVM